MHYYAIAQNDLCYNEDEIQLCILLLKILFGDLVKIDPLCSLILVSKKNLNDPELISLIQKILDHFFASALFIELPY